MFGGSLGQIANTASWINAFELREKETSEPLDLSEAVITMKVCRRDGGSPVLTGSTTSGDLEVVSLGVIEWRFEKSRMQGLCPGTYDCSIDFDRYGDSDKLFLGNVTILRGN